MFQSVAITTYTFLLWEHSLIVWLSGNRKSMMEVTQSVMPTYQFLNKITGHSKGFSHVFGQDDKLTALNVNTLIQVGTKVGNSCSGRYLSCNTYLLLSADFARHRHQYRIYWSFYELALRPWWSVDFRSLRHVNGAILHSTSSHHLPFESLKIFWSLIYLLLLFLNLYICL